MSNKILVFDVDGTLVNNKGIVTDKTKRAIIEAQRNGNKLIICSGRTKRGIESAIKNLYIHFDYYVCHNGAETIDINKNSLVESITIPYSFIEIIRNEIPKEIDWYALSEYEYYAENFNNEWLQMEIGQNNTRVNKYNRLDNTKLYRVSISGKESDITKFQQNVSSKVKEVFNITRTAKNIIEFTTPGINKGKAIEKLIKINNWNREDIICFGDAPNDKEMLDIAGIGVLMSNCKSEEMLKNAKYITLSNEEDGIAYALKDLEII